MLMVALSAALGVPPAIAQSIDGYADSRFIEHRERFTPTPGLAIDLRFMIARETATQSARVVDATHAALVLLSEWFGPPPFSSLTVAGVPWHPVVRSGTVAGVVTTHLRWLTTARDQSTEREIIEGIARQYWPGVVDTRTGFGRSLIAYTAARATHHRLEGSNFATLRFFGRVVPFSLRSVLLSPPVADSRPRVFRFDEHSPVDADLWRELRALQTLERYVGWPTMLQSLSTLRADPSSPYDTAALGAALSEARGTDMRPLVAECFRADAVFDYAMADLQSQPRTDGLAETAVTIARLGSGQFTGSQGDALMLMRVRFSDGTEIRDTFDGAAPFTSLVYTAPAPAVSATVDPDAMLLLDVNRQNNAIVRGAGTSRLGIRLALNWMAWLQQAMLSYTAIL